MSPDQATFTLAHEEQEREEESWYTYIDVSQISGAVNDCIWLVVKAAPLIPRGP